MKTTLIRHIVSGETYAVYLDDDGSVTSAAGPLHYSNFQAALDEGFDSDPELVDDINATPAQYEPFLRSSLEH